MGHADIETTSKSYINAADQDVARAHRSASPLAHILNKGQGNLPGDKEAETEKQAYKETTHKKKMRELSKLLADKISLPSLWDKDLLRDLPVDFKPGRYSLPIGLVEIGKDKRIRVDYNELISAVAETHLSSELKFAGLAGDKGEIEKWARGVGRYFEAALDFLSLIAGRVREYQAEVNYSPDAALGLTRWFPITIWRDAIITADGHTWIDDSWYHPPESIANAGLWQVVGGNHGIGIARSQEMLDIYKNWHKSLREEYAKDEPARRIAARSKDLEAIAKEIGQRLREFGDLECLPGHCELC
jgi:hypothetical protein